MFWNDWLTGKFLSVSHQRDLFVAKTCRFRAKDQHRWFSGRMLACHAGGQGSIPGRCMSEVAFVRIIVDVKLGWQVLWLPVRNRLYWDLTADVWDISSKGWTWYHFHSLKPLIQHLEWILFFTVQSEVWGYCKGIKLTFESCASCNVSEYNEAVVTVMKSCYCWCWEKCEKHWSEFCGEWPYKFFR